MQYFLQFRGSVYVETECCLVVEDALADLLAEAAGLDVANKEGGGAELLAELGLEESGGKEGRDGREEGT